MDAMNDKAAEVDSDDIVLDAAIAAMKIVVLAIDQLREMVEAERQEIAAASKNIMNEFVARDPSKWN